MKAGMTLMASDYQEVLGKECLAPKFSAVRDDGTLRQRDIEGVLFRSTRPVPHEDGCVTEIVRLDWQEIDQPILHTHVTSTLPGRVRAWGLHWNSTDRLFVVSGLVSIVVFDGRVGSSTFGCVNEFRLCDKNPGLVIIPPRLYHGWKNIGTSEAYIINMPSAPYDYDNPDALDLPYDSQEASSIVPHRW